MTPRDVRSALLSTPVPDELEAQRRTWGVVKAAYAEREPVRRPRRLRLLVALAVLAALVAAALSPPGRAVGDWVRDRVAGEEETQPALFQLPAAGELLVVSEEGPWLVRPDGSKRRLGAYDDASFSPSARFVVATSGRRVVALEPDGDPRWSVTRPDPVADARWAPSPGFRVAYRAGDTLRVVAGDGTGDRLLAENVAAVAPAWQPLEGRTVLAYADAAGRVHVADSEGEERWSAEPGAPPAKLVWSSDGRVLLVVTTGARHPFYRQSGRRAGSLRTPAAHSVLDAEFEPGTRRVAYSAFDGERRHRRPRRGAAPASRGQDQRPGVLSGRPLAPCRLARGRPVPLPPPPRRAAASSQSTTPAASSTQGAPGSASSRASRAGAALVRRASSRSRSRPSPGWSCRRWSSSRRRRRRP